MSGKRSLQQGGVRDAQLVPALAFEELHGGRCPPTTSGSRVGTIAKLRQYMRRRLAHAQCCTELRQSVGSLAPLRHAHHAGTVEEMQQAPLTPKGTEEILPSKRRTRRW